MKLLVCGGRDFDDVEFAVTHLTRLHETRGITELIHGAARGADTIAGQRRSAFRFAPSLRTGLSMAAGLARSGISKC